MALVVSKARTVKKSSPLTQIQVQKYNPNHGSDGRFASGGGGGGKAPIKEGDLSLNYFEKKADKAYGTGENAFTIAHTGDASTAALGTYLGKGHLINDNLRQNKLDVTFSEGERKKSVQQVADGLDNAINMAPRMPNQTVWRTTSADAIKNLRVGSTYTDKGYTSTTAADITHPDNGLLLLTLSKVSGGQKAIMEIRTGKEGKGLYMPKMFPGQPIADFEKEFLLPRNTKMKYTGVDLRPIPNSDRWLQVHQFRVVN